MERLCPICRKAVSSDSSADFPFCSERCRLLDLGNWASGRYVITEPVIDEAEPPLDQPEGSSPNEDER